MGHLRGEGNIREERGMLLLCAGRERRRSRSKEGTVEGCRYRQNGERGIFASRGAWLVRRKLWAGFCFSCRATNRVRTFPSTGSCRSQTPVPSSPRHALSMRPTLRCSTARVRGMARFPKSGVGPPLVHPRISLYEHCSKWVSGLVGNDPLERFLF